MQTRTKKYNDTMTMAGRCLLLSRRNPDTFLTSIVLPILMMLLFLALFGSQVQVGDISYVNYIVPGVLLQCFGQCSSVTAISVNRDMRSQMVSRFGTLPIKKSAILSGHVLESMVRNTLTTAVVLAVAALLGFRPSGGVLDWCVVLLVLAGIMAAFSWLAVAIGITAKSPEGASGAFTFAIVLPYLSSGFVPTASMPKALAVFAEHQPMTPIIETLRNAMLGNPMEHELLLTALLWCGALTLCFYLLAQKLFRRQIEK